MGAELAMKRSPLKVMTNLKHKVLAVAIACFLSGGALAQRSGDDKPRPPKDKEDRPKVVVQPKEKPPQNNNQGGDKRNDGKKGSG
jgi:hypothetical protein